MPAAAPLRASRRASVLLSLTCARVLSALVLLFGSSCHGIYVESQL